MYKKRTSLIVVSFIAFLIVFDQWSKWYVKTHFTLHEEYKVWGDWFKFLFIENEGMAFGFRWGGDAGKVTLTLFRLAAVVWGSFFLRRIIRSDRYPIGCLLCLGLVYAGAIGNTIDSLFYGLIYGESSYTHTAVLFPSEGGYGNFLFGKVVDMLYFPLIQSSFPEWVPIWGGERFEFFSPIFNIADACVSVGSFGLAIFYYRLLGFKKTDASANTNS